MSEKRALPFYPEHVSFYIDIPDKTVCDVLQERAGEFGSQPALTFYDKTITYAELAAAVNRFASSLQARGVQKGDRVAIMLPNCPQYVIAYYGILQAGAIVTQVNPMLVERELAYLLKDSGAKMIVIYEPLYPRLAAVRGETAVEQAVTVSLGAPPSVALAEGDVRCHV
ncbi:Long-chain-fatty-acid--CoA ligase [[Flavobacterium] thermophilum]|nr:Long-chain-fatty-acid--CoA ligase [[Flavobacterium] thermophilum]